MKPTKFLSVAFLFLLLLVSFNAFADKCPEGKECPDDETTTAEEEYDYEQLKLENFRRLYTIFGVGGAYFVKKDGIGLDGNVGIYTNLEFRLFKIFSIGFDSYYGYLIGGGNQYLSAFNPGIKIYPWRYKNPSFEPFLFLGGHVYEGVIGDSAIGSIGMGQGGFAGVGAKMAPESSPLGMEFFIRSSFISMERQRSVGGRGLVIPIFGFVGVTY